MAENLIPKIAHMLGVEVGEEFKLKGSRLTYKFYNNGIEYIYGENKGVRILSADAILALLRGQDEVIKLPWKPKTGDTYYYFINVYDFTNAYGKWTVHSRWWSGTPSEYALLKAGWVFRTKEEAETALPAIAKEFGVEYE